MRHCKSKLNKTYSGSSYSVAPVSALQGKVDSAEVVAGYPTEDSWVVNHRIFMAFTGRTRTVTPAGADLEKVLSGVDSAEFDNMMVIMG